MASFSLDDFVGNGTLKGLLPKLLEEGWDDVPTLKLMNPEDMGALNMNQQQKDALEIRTYLHDRVLMQYADRLEALGKCLPELLNLSSGDLYGQFGMKRGHIARFIERTAPSEPLSKSSVVLSKRGPGAAGGLSQAPSRTSSIYNRSFESQNSNNKIRLSFAKSPARSSPSYFDRSLEQSLAEIKIKDGYVFKGIVAAGPAEPRACGCVQAPQVTEKVAPYSVIENVSVQRLTPEYKLGMDWLVKTKTPPMKASELWRDKPAVLLCLRRPGAEAHQLYSRKPIFDALGVQLFAILHEHIESEVRDFWPRYWGGAVLYDRGGEFFKALGGGKLLKDSFFSGFLLNPIARANYKRAKAMGVDQNLKGEGEIKGGLFIVGSGKSGIAYQFIERNFGDWAPLAEAIEICTQLQNQQRSQAGTKSNRSSQEFG
ncbi:hypothetical protein CDL15_Pgr009503 [Punica granatum]|uniref:Peroxiredoxin-like 2A n=1 Tax=Punica granatum TaxID=22663 RepID=A0A218WTN1_PUNGR|nr:hypothetical protein CDL15_Pgr009503 [Punica granatum]